MKSSAPTTSTTDTTWKRPNRFTIWVYKNGDEYDPGTKIAVTRMHMPHWISFLDDLTHRLNLVEGSVQYIYTIDGEEIRHFRQLENNGRYVAAHGKFKRRDYGGGKAKKPPFGVQTALYEDNNDGGRLGIYADEGLRHYLQQRDFQPTLGDIWDNTQFDMRATRLPRIYQEASRTVSLTKAANAENHYSNGTNGNNGNNGTNDYSLQNREHSRLTRTEGLAASIMSRINRSRSVGITRNRSSERVNGGIKQTNGTGPSNGITAQTKSNRGSKSQMASQATMNGGLVSVYSVTAAELDSSNIINQELTASQTPVLPPLNLEAVGEVGEKNEGNGILDSSGTQRTVSGEEFNPDGTFDAEQDNEQESPRWATELTQAVRQLASEVHHLHRPLTNETDRSYRNASHKSK